MSSKDFGWWCSHCLLEKVIRCCTAPSLNFFTSRRFPLGLLTDPFVFILAVEFVNVKPVA